MSQSFDELLAWLQHLRWNAGRLIRLCDSEEAELQSFHEVAPEEVEQLALRVRARLLDCRNAAFSFDLERGHYE